MLKLSIILPFSFDASLLHKLTLAQLSRNSPRFKEPEDSSHCSQGPTTEPYPEAVQSSLQQRILFL